MRNNISKTYKIGVFGSAGGEMGKNLKLAARVGELLASQKCIILTGACPGLPYAAAESAAKNKAKIWGFSPEYNLKEQKTAYPTDDASIYDKLIYTPKNSLLRNPLVRKKYRNTISTSVCDAGIIIAGRWGSLHETCSLYDYGKVIGVLEGTGGIADELRVLNKKIYKPGNGKFIFSKSPDNLIIDIIKELNKRK